MSRYPNLAALGDNLAFPGRPNGYRRRRMWLAAGSYSWTVPDDLPVGADGFGRIKAVAIGGGAGAYNGSGGDKRDGGGGGLSLFDGIRVKPGDSATISVGAAGANKVHTDPASGVNGGNSSIAIASVTLTANGGQKQLGGTASGGQVNSSGSNGGASGTPWGNGEGRGWINPFSISPQINPLVTGGDPDPEIVIPNDVDVVEMYLRGRSMDWWDIEDIANNYGPNLGMTYSDSTPVYRIPALLGGASQLGKSGNGAGATILSNSGFSSYASGEAGAGAVIVWF